MSRRSSTSPTTARAPKKAGGARESRAEKGARAPKSAKAAASPRAPKNEVVLVGYEPRVDLLPPEVSAQKRSRRTVRRAWGAVAVLAVVAVGGIGVATYESLTATESLMREQAHTGALVSESTKYSQVLKIQSETAAVEAAQKVGASTEIDWKDYLTKVQSTLPTGVTITSVSIDSATPLETYAQSTGTLQGPRIATLTFTATSPSIPSVPDWLDSLADIRGYVDASPGSVEKDSTTSTYKASITMHINQKAFDGRFASAEKGD